MHAQPDLELAAALFTQLGAATQQGRGIVRDSYGRGVAARALQHVMTHCPIP